MINTYSIILENDLKKLTLSVDEETLEDAKRLAMRSGTSVSAMFRRLVRTMARKEPARVQLGPITQRATGLVVLPSERTDRELVEEALEERYDPAE